MDTTVSKTTGQPLVGSTSAAPTPETTKEPKPPQHRFDLNRNRSTEPSRKTYPNVRNYDSDSSVQTYKRMRYNPLKRNLFNGDNGNGNRKSYVAEPKRDYDVSGLRNWRRSVATYAQMRRERYCKNDSSSSDDSSEDERSSRECSPIRYPPYHDVKYPPKHGIVDYPSHCNRNNLNRRGAHHRRFYDNNRKRKLDGPCNSLNCRRECLKICIPYEFNGCVIAKLTINESVNEVIYSLHSVTKNIIVASKTSNKMSVVFHDVPVDTYKVSAEINYKHYQPKVCTSQELDVGCHLKNKRYNLIHAKPCEKFRYGEKYKQIHTLYDNVDDYFIEVGFNENRGYECFLNDYPISSRYQFTKAYEQHHPHREEEYAEFLKHRYILRTEVSRKELVNVANLFDSLPYVDYTSITPKRICFLRSEENHVLRRVECCEHTRTPDFTDRQKLQLSSLNVLDAWKNNYFGEDVTIRMVSLGTNQNHEDLNGRVIKRNKHKGRHVYSERGTATAGVVVANDNHIGVTGIAHESKFYAYENLCLEKFEDEFAPGDIVIVSLELLKNDYWVPVSDNLGIWLRLKLASDRGMIVLQSAGFGNLDLSSGLAFNNHGDSGAVTVGALGGNNCRDKHTNYNHSSSVWTAGGQNVTTTGYGDLYDGGEDRRYTLSFGGSPASLAQVSGAIALIQSKLQKKGISASVWEMRELVKMFSDSCTLNTGLGVRPNVYETIRHI